MKPSTEHIDSDSGRSPSGDEKTIGVEQGALETRGDGELPPDPDAHLSPEERAAIVCSIHDRPPKSFILQVFMADHCLVGPQTSLETYVFSNFIFSLRSYSQDVFQARYSLSLRQY